MTIKTNEKTASFYTSGSTIADLAAARRAKAAKFRAVIRACFYLHCVIALVCIVLSIAFSAGFDIIKISVCALTSVVFAFFAVGDLEHINAFSCVVDFVFAAGGYVLSVFGEHRTLYLICGILMTVLALSTVLSGIAAHLKRNIRTAPLMTRAERRTAQSDDTDDIPDMPELFDIPDLPEDLMIGEPPEIPPQPAGKMRELANLVCEIICGETNKNS